MKKMLLQTLSVALLCCAVGNAGAQPAPLFDNLPINYQAAAPVINELVHTKLDIRFDYGKQYVYGREWLTARPHCYPVDSLVLDAKGMEIHSVSIYKGARPVPLKFNYDQLNLMIRLDRMYNSSEPYTVYIEYTAKPAELKNRRKNQKGLYFINADGKDKNKPIQIWTEGETENASAWFPTIDKPNQKTTQEIDITVPAQYVTLSNGKLISQKMNADSTRTDSWKMDLPNSPYLFMMAVGDFKIYKDHWRDREVDYYLEPAYAPFAKQIFGETPEAMEFFSTILGVDYPWNKYAQVVVRDYVSGAMENTTATVMGELMQGTEKELADRYYPTGIVHELFHQWFGDYVTAESWSNLTLNESLAVLGEILWLEHKYGKDIADAHNFAGLQAYLDNPEAKNKNLVRFSYADDQELFDAVTYQKGGCILNMLRTYLGNKAFYKGLNIYLKTNAYKSAEVHQLRLAFEEASGLDLNWFFNQWYFGAGHPEITIDHKWNENTKTETIYFKQTQNGSPFILPIAIDFYTEGRIDHRQCWMTGKTDTLVYKFSKKPNLVNADASKTLVVKKTDNKSPDEYLFQYFNAPLFVDRFEALNAAIANPGDSSAKRIILAALKDKNFNLRIKAIDALTLTGTGSNVAVTLLDSLIRNDENNLVKAAAISRLGKLKQDGSKALFQQSLKVESYAVQGAALEAIGHLDTALALTLAKQFESDNKQQVAGAILKLYASYGGNDQWPYMYSMYQSLRPPKQFNMIQDFAALTGRVENPEFAAQGIKSIKELGIQGKQFGASAKIIEVLNEVKKQRLSINDNASASIIDQAIKEINDAK